MKSKSGYVLLLTGIFFCANVFSQTDYKTGLKNKDGFVSIYITTYKPAANYYTTSSSDTRYGLMEEKTKKIVLPIKYKMVYTSYEDGLYIVQDSLEKTGLFSAKSGKFLIEPTYNRIEAFSEGVAIVQKKVGSGYSYDYYYGAIDKNGKLIIPDSFTYLGNCRDGLLNFKQSDKYGFIDKQNKVIIPAMYSDMSTFSSGLAPAKLGERTLYGYINKENKFVIEPKYVDAETFYLGYANVYMEKAGYGSKGGSYGSDKVGLIDAKGNEIIQPIYKTISLKKDGGNFIVTKDDKQGMFDSTGKIVLSIDNKKIDEFYGGIARVEQTVGMYGLVNTKGKWLLPADYFEINSLYSDGGYYARKDGKYIVYNHDLKIIIAADTAKRITISKKNIAYIFNNGVKVFDVSGKYIKTVKQENIDLYGTTFFSNDDSLKVPYFKAISLYNLQAKTSKSIYESDISDFNEDGFFMGKSVGKWSFYDYTGKKLSDKSFENAVNFSEGICAVQDNSYSKPYLADKSLNKITDLGVVFYGPYSEGIAMAKSQYSGTVYYLDKKGNTQFYVYGTEGSACKNNRIKIKNDLGKFYFINKYGKTINNNTYDDLGDFSDNLAGFRSSNKYGFMDTSGNVVIAATYDQVSVFTNGTAIVKSGNDYFQIDKKGKPINSNKYLSAANPENGYFPVKKNSGFGLVDNNGNTIIDFKYQNITPMKENIAWAQKNDKWGLVNASKNELTAFEYEGGTSFDNGFAQVVKTGKVGLVDKTGKLVLPIEYSNFSKVYKNTILTVKSGGTATYSVK